MFRYSSLLPARSGRTVALLADAEVGAELTSYIAAFAGDRVTVLAAAFPPEWETTKGQAAFRLARNLNETHTQLARLGPIDVLINLQTQTGEAHLKTFGVVFYYIRLNGAYLVARKKITTAGEKGLLARLARISQFVGYPEDQLEDIPAQIREQARSSSPIVLAADFVIVGKRNQHLLKVREGSGTTPLLRKRGLRVTAVATLAAGTLEARGTITSHYASVDIAGLDPTIPYPPMFVRRYQGRVALAPGAVVYHDHSILPDTFRWHLEKDPINPRLENVSPRFARLRDYHRPVVELPGSYYYLEYSNVGHFGHLMSEALAKLWGWDVAKGADPDLKMILRTSTRGGSVSPEPVLDRRLIEAYGLAPDDIVWVDEPVWVESLVGVTPMWHNRVPYYAHPAMAEVWRRLREGITAQDGPSHRRIFVTRRVGNRMCRNVAEVENVFAAHGFEIIHPERLPISHQASVFSGAEIIAGFGGSNLFNLLWAENLNTLIVLNHEAYDSRSEHLYATVLGVDSHYFWSKADLAQPEDGWSYEAFQSDWEFDFARNGRELEQLLRTLD